MLLPPGAKKLVMPLHENTSTAINHMITIVAHFVSDIIIIITTNLACHKPKLQEQVRKGNLRKYK